MTIETDSNFLPTEDPEMFVQSLRKHPINLREKIKELFEKLRGGNIEKGQPDTEELLNDCSFPE